jgi:aspartokinase-like uncharacterized kinase
VADRVPITVYKVGGSLLDLPELAERLYALLWSRSHTRPLLIAGGGAAANLVREWDSIHQLGEERSHWLALKSMELNEAVLTSIAPSGLRVGTRKEAEAAWKAEQVPILALLDAVFDDEIAAIPFPHTWDLTSDTLAAWVALCWQAEELVLLKSVALPEGLPIDAGFDAGLVDRYFAAVASRLPRIGWLNLRDAQAVLHWWQPPRDLSGQP